MPAQADLVHETSVSTGAGSFTTAAINGKQRFSDAGAFGTGATLNVFDYFISNRDAAEWERGTGHMSAVGTLVRDTVLAGSNGTSLVGFTAGTKDITNDIPAGQQARIKVTPNGDSNVTLVSTDRIAATSAALTAARTWTLMAANSLPPGTLVKVIDTFGGVTATNTLSVVRAGADTINGGSGSITLNRAYGWVALETDGTSKWTILGVSRAKKVTVYTGGSGTHVPDAFCTEIRARAIAGGAGGVGSGASAGTAPGGGGNTTFGNLTTVGGAIGGWAGQGGAGGGFTIGSGWAGIGQNGGHGGSVPGFTQIDANGGQGGAGAFGSGAQGAARQSPQVNAANTGAGGGGAGGTVGVTYGGGGGGAGGYIDAVTTGTVAASYPYAVAAGGTAGAAGPSGQAGGAGSSGYLEIEEDFR